MSVAIYERVKKQSEIPSIGFQTFKTGMGPIINHFVDLFFIQCSDRLYTDFSRMADQ